MRAPKFTHGIVDRFGKAHYYFRRPGFKSVTLPGLPWSPAFMETYADCMAGQETAARKTRPGTLAALTVAYFNSTEFWSLAPGTQRRRRNILKRFCAANGDRRVALLQRDDIVRLLGLRMDKPAVARNWLHSVRAMMQVALDLGMIKADPTRDVKSPKVSGPGFIDWNEESIAAFEATHPIGSRARLALALLLYTAQRRGDVVKMSRQHVRDGALHVQQQKTGAVLAIPVHPQLQAIIDAMPVDQMTFLITKDGKPFTGPGFGNWFREMCDAASLPNLSAHGLRKSACRRLAEAGCSASEIRAISGHASLAEVERYVRAADQARMARSAMATVTKAFPAKART
jgi:integrase